MNLKSILFASLLATAAGLGLGSSASSAADLECRANCRDVRYECFAQRCHGTTPNTCTQICNAEFNACVASCG
jgi:hypothetical protein